MAYPRYVKINGVKYPINTSYKTAMQCFDVIDDESICDTERSLAVIYLLFGFIPDNDLDKFLEMAVKYLGCGEPQENHQARNRDMDLRQDWKYILASFAADYHIDLNKEDIHFFQFMDLIQGLTEKSVLSRVREIRNYDLNEIKDPKTRAKMAEAKQNLELKGTVNREEQELLDEFESLFQ